MTEAERDRDRLAAEVERLKYRLFFIEIEAGAMRQALSALVRQVEDSGLHRRSCIRTKYDTDDLPEGAECECFDPAMEEALAALAGSAGRRALAQLAAGRALAEALTAAREDPGLYRLGQDQATAWEHGSAGARKSAESDAEAIHARIDAALAAWNRAAAGEGGAK